VTQLWIGARLELTEWKDTGALVLRKTDELIANLDDSLLKLQTLSVSAYVKPHMERITFWTKHLLQVQTFVFLWLDTQSKWVYLVPLFSTNTIIKQMAEEGRLFSEVDRMWRQLAIEVNRTPVILEAAARSSLIDEMRDQVNALKP
jgi:dynein heavy chain